MIIIPAIDIMGGKVVRLKKGDPANQTIYGNDPLEFARRWESEGADMLHIVDLDATLGLGSNSEAIAQISTESGVPVEIAGGLRSVDVALGAAGQNNRIVLGTMALTDIDSAVALRDKLGSSRVVISLDHRAGMVTIRGWTQTTGMALADAMDSLVARGFTEFMITDVDRDGMQVGPELDRLADACTRKANVIASGGISGAGDITTVRKCGAHGVILGRAIYEGALGVREAKETACL